MATIITEQITFTMVKCANCFVPFMITQHMDNKLRDSGEAFTCPSGHSNYYGTTTLEKRLADAEREKQTALNRIANLSSEKVQLEIQLKNEQRKLNRVKKGVCPCCNRTFSDLQRHMATKHPDKTGKK
jgi:hypothetical protein